MERVVLLRDGACCTAAWWSVLYCCVMERVVLLRDGAGFQYNNVVCVVGLVIRHTNDIRSSACYVVMFLCCYVVMLLFWYIVMLLLCCYAVILCCYAVMLFCCYAVMFLCCYVVVLLCCYAVILLYYVVILLCCYAVILLCCYAVMLLCCYAVICGMSDCDTIYFHIISQTTWFSWKRNVVHKTFNKTPFLNEFRLKSFSFCAELFRLCFNQS